MQGGNPFQAFQSSANVAPPPANLQGAYNALFSAERFQAESAALPGKAIAGAFKGFQDTLDTHTDRVVRQKERDQNFDKNEASQARAFLEQRTQQSQRIQAAEDRFTRSQETQRAQFDERLEHEKEMFGSQVAATAQATTTAFGRNIFMNDRSNQYREGAAATAEGNRRAAAGESHDFDREMFGAQTGANVDASTVNYNRQVEMGAVQNRYRAEAAQTAEGNRSAAAGQGRAHELAMQGNQIDASVDANTTAFGRNLFMGERDNQYREGAAATATSDRAAAAEEKRMHDLDMQGNQNAARSREGRIGFTESILMANLANEHNMSAAERDLNNRLSLKAFDSKQAAELANAKQTVLDDFYTMSLEDYETQDETVYGFNMLPGLEYEELPKGSTELPDRARAMVSGILAERSPAQQKAIVAALMAKKSYAEVDSGFYHNFSKALAGVGESAADIATTTNQLMKFNKGKLFESRDSAIAHIRKSFDGVTELLPSLRQEVTPGPGKNTLFNEEWNSFSVTPKAIEGAPLDPAAMGKYIKALDLGPNGTEILKRNLQNPDNFYKTFKWDVNIDMVEGVPTMSFGDSAEPDWVDYRHLDLVNLMLRDPLAQSMKAWVIGRGKADPAAALTPSTIQGIGAKALHDAKQPVDPYGAMNNVFDMDN